MAFSVGVFAITITLLVLNITPPTDDRNLLQGLLALWPSYLAYAVTFLFIGQVWANHHVVFDHIRAADRVVLFLNTLVLMAVAFLPFATSVLAGALRSGHGERTAVVFYALAFDVTALTFNAFTGSRSEARVPARDPDQAWLLPDIPRSTTTQPDDRSSSHRRACARRPAGRSHVDRSREHRVA